MPIDLSTPGGAVLGLLPELTLTRVGPGDAAVDRLAP